MIGGPSSATALTPGHGVMQPTDAELVTLALSGAEEGYRQLVARFERPIFSILIRMVRDPTLAEDLAQETFVKAFRHLGRFDRDRKLASWLFKIAHNTAIDHLRRKQLAVVPLERGKDEAGLSPADVAAAPETEHPDRVAMHHDLTDGIEVALGALRPAYREVLLLRFQESLTYEEISEVTGQPMGTVKVQLHRARKQLAKHLAAAGWGTA